MRRYGGACASLTAGVMLTLSDGPKGGVPLADSAGDADGDSDGVAGGDARDSEATEPDATEADGECALCDSAAAVAEDVSAAEQWQHLRSGSAPALCAHRHAQTHAQSPAESGPAHSRRAWQWHAASGVVCAAAESLPLADDPLSSAAASLVAADWSSFSVMDDDEDEGGADEADDADEADEEAEGSEDDSDEEEEAGPSCRLWWPLSGAESELSPSAGACADAAGVCTERVIGEGAGGAVCEERLGVACLLVDTDADADVVVVGAAFMSGKPMRRNML